MCWCVTIPREEDRIRTLARCLYCNIKKNMSSVVLPQTAYFCHQLRLNRWVLLCSDFGDKSPHGMVEWWQCCLCLTEYTVCFCVCVRDLKGMSWWRQKKKKDKGGEMVLAAPGGNWVWCYSMQLLPNTHTLPVGVCVYFLCIGLVSHVHMRKEEPVLFQLSWRWRTHLNEYM